MRSGFYYILIGFLLALTSCSQENKVVPAFYHWQSTFNLSPSEEQALETLGTKRLYLRYFDIDLQANTGKPVPVARLQAQPPYPQDIELVPCIFITNRSLKAISLEEVDTLGQRIFDQLLQIQNRIQMPSPNEVQLDCDWTPSTQENYFRLLAGIKPLLAARNCQLSCTIRLHQYKYPDETGVPEVDRGMLMVYNVGNLDDPEEENSIFNLETVRSYVLPQRDYPLQLDVALPIFGWGVLLRNGQPIKLLNNLTMEQTFSDSLLQAVSPSRVEVKQSHYFYGRYLYTGDQIRFEAVTSENLLAGADLLADVLPEAPSRCIALYHLDAHTLNQYAFDTLEIVYRAFH